MRWFSLAPTLAAMPLIASLVVNNITEPARAEAGIADEARAVVAFWRAAGPAHWFAKDDAFDKRFRERFLAAHEAAARSEFADWATNDDGALALVILLDQFPRNAFRGAARMYATDGHARLVADAAIRAGHDRAVENEIAKFFYLPFAHSEDLHAARSRPAGSVAGRRGTARRRPHHRETATVPPRALPAPRRGSGSLARAASS
jgi:uncharacterized protein (DUF924 family)